MESFEQIYTLYFKDVYRYIYSLCQDSSLAEEITQETFFLAMKNIHSFRGDCKLLVWLCQISKHLYYAHQNKVKRQTQRPLGMVITDTEKIFLSSSLEQRLLDEADALTIHEHLHQLEEPYKEVFMLRVFGELSYQKIAHIFGKTENWARVTYHRAKLNLINRMEESNGKNKL